MITNVVAFDLETEMIPDRQRVFAKSGRSINVSPYVPPAPALVAVADSTGTKLYKPSRWTIPTGSPLVGHNISFDVTVYMEHYGSTRPLFMQMADKGQLFDTMILDWLIRLARGEFDYPVYDRDTGWAVPRSETRSLAACAKAYLDVDLPKDESIRLTFGQFIDTPVEEIPEEHRMYAMQDADITYRIFHEQIEELRGSHNGAWPQHWDDPRWWLSHHIHLRASLVASAMDMIGAWCDQEEARRLQAMFSQDLGPLETKLETYGLGRYKPVPKAPRESTKLMLPMEGHDWRKLDGS